MQQSSYSRQNTDRSQGKGDRNQSRGRGHGGHNRPPQRRHSRPPSNVAAEIIHGATRRIGTLPKVTLFILALLGGGLMVLAAVFGVQLASAIEHPIWQQLTLSFAFSAGIFLVMASNSVLFTEANILVPANLYGVKIGSGFLRLFIFWLVAWLGNYVGVYLTVWLLKLSGLQLNASAAFVKTLTEQTLVLSAESTSIGLIPLFISGILANWVIGISTLFAAYNRVAMGKITCLLIGVALVMLAHFQYFPINVALLGVAGLVDAGFNNMTMLVNHLIPVSLGNLVGGAFLVSLPLLIQMKRSR